MPERPKERSEAILVQRVLAGDRSAYSEIVKSYQNPLYRYCLRFMKDSEDASDQVQETFVKAFKNLAKFDTRRPLSPWLYRIARNTCLDAIRRRGSNPVRTDSSLGRDEDEGRSVLDKAEATGVDSDPEAVAEGKQLGAEVARHVEALDPKYREVIQLYHFDQLTYEQIAQVLKVPLGTVMTRLFRARKKLAEKLKEYA